MLPCVLHSAVSDLGLKLYAKVPLKVCQASMGYRNDPKFSDGQV